MTQERRDQIIRQVAEWNKLRDKSGPEKKMLKALRELLDVTPATDDMLKAEYDRGHRDGVQDEADREYERKTKKAAKPPVPAAPELPFGEVE